MTQKKFNCICIVLLIILFLLIICSLMVGPSGWAPMSWNIKNSLDYSIIKFRLNRTILALIAGSSLAVSGASLQALFQNTLADPHLFGISGGAALGASIVIAFFFESAVVLPSIGAILGGSLAFLLIFFYMQTLKNKQLSHCLLVGVLINSIAASLITLLKTTLPAHKTQSLLFWLIGHLNIVEPSHFFLIIPLWLTGMIALFLIKDNLELLSFGLEEAQLLGINATNTTKIAVIANCILIGNVVAFAGMIGFLGLVIPHIIRLLFNANMHVLLPIASIVGALCLVIFDMLSRASFMIIGSEIPVGALCALFLSPVFFLLLIKSNTTQL